jgi:hypothetical protein
MILNYGAEEHNVANNGYMHCKVEIARCTLMSSLIMNSWECPRSADKNKKDTTSHGAELHS